MDRLLKVSEPFCSLKTSAHSHPYGALPGLSNLYQMSFPQSVIPLLLLLGPKGSF
jgi:hypothetical protein